LLSEKFERVIQLFTGVQTVLTRPPTDGTELALKDQPRWSLEAGLLWN